jgi:hypothetical protein
MAIKFEHSLDGILNLGLLGHVERDGKGLSAGETDLFSQGGKTIHAPGSQNNNTAFFGKQPRRIRPETGGSPGDENNFVL